jgi:hypothetical protein
MKTQMNLASTMALTNLVIEKSGILLKSPMAISTFFSPLKYGEFGGIFSKKLFCTSCRPPFFFSSPSDQISQEKKKPWSQFQLFRISMLSVNFKAQSRFQVKFLTDQAKAKLPPHWDHGKNLKTHLNCL